MGDDDIGLIKALGFVAWSDERIAPEEREMLTTVMDALAIPEQRRHDLCEALRKAPPTLDEIAAAFSDDLERRFAVAQAVMLARVDGEVAAEEVRDIRRLAQALGIADDELELIQTAVDVTDDVMSGRGA